MLYWKYSPNRTFFLNEYWILIPTAILANYLVIRQIRCRKKRNQEFKKLIEQIEHAKRIRRIVYLAIGLDGLSRILIRGGADFIDVSYIECGIEEGLRFLDNERLRKIIHDLYRHKRKGKIIYITATALCKIANQYGQTFLALPVAIGDFGLTNLYQTVRKVGVTVLLGGVGPLFVIGNPVALICAFVLATSGLRLAFSNFDFIRTSPISETGSAENLKPRIADLPDVVVVNSQNKIIMTNPGQEKVECWLPDQALFNSGCKVKPTEIPNAIDLVSHNLKYDDVVNMQDVTGLDRVDFSDVLDLGQAKPRKGKVVNFLDKFGDSGPIDEMDTWDASEYSVPEKRYLRTKNEL